MQGERGQWEKTNKQINRAFVVLSTIKINKKTVRELLVMLKQEIMMVVTCKDQSKDSRSEDWKRQVPVRPIKWGKAIIIFPTVIGQ